MSNELGFNPTDGTLHQMEFVKIEDFVKFNNISWELISRNCKKCFRGSSVV